MYSTSCLVPSVFCTAMGHLLRSNCACNIIMLDFIERHIQPVCSHHLRIVDGGGAGLPSESEIHRIFIVQWMSGHVCSRDQGENSLGLVGGADELGLEKSPSYVCWPWQLCGLQVGHGDGEQPLPSAENLILPVLGDVV